MNFVTLPFGFCEVTSDGIDNFPEKEVLIWPLYTCWFKIEGHTFRPWPLRPFCMNMVRFELWLGLLKSGKRRFWPKWAQKRYFDLIKLNFEDWVDERPWSCLQGLVKVKFWVVVWLTTQQEAERYFLGAILNQNFRNGGWLPLTNRRRASLPSTMHCTCCSDAIAS